MVVIYHFYSFWQSSPGQILRSLTRQLLIANTELAPYILEEFIDKGLTPTKKTLGCILQFLVSSNPFVRIIIDGLDEAPQSEQEEIIEDLLRIKDLNPGTCKLLFASRQTWPISQKLQGQATVNLLDSIEHVNDKISSFIRSRLSRLRLAPHFSDELEHRVVARAKGDHVTLPLTEHY